MGISFAVDAWRGVIMYKGIAIRIFPYSKYILFKGDYFGDYYGINYILYKMFCVRRCTKCFKTYAELKRYMETRGFKITR